MSVWIVTLEFSLACGPYYTSASIAIPRSPRRTVELTGPHLALTITASEGFRRGALLTGVTGGDDERGDHYRHAETEHSYTESNRQLISTGVVLRRTPPAGRIESFAS